MFLALRVDPYVREARVVQLQAKPEPPVLSIAQALEQGLLYYLAAHNERVPVAHWDLFDPLVHAGRSDPRERGLTDLSARLLYKTPVFRAVLWLRDDMPVAGSPERDAIPGFAFRDSKFPGVWWGGVGFVSLYTRDGPFSHSDVAFLEQTIGAISFTRLEEYQQCSRVKMTISNKSAVKFAQLAPCASCGTFMENRKRCMGCERIYYCSKACQHAHWAEHKGWCRRIAAASL